MTVVAFYDPVMPDELPLVPGEVVSIKNVYSDGWALAMKMGVLGVVPLCCLDVDEEEGLGGYGREGKGIRDVRQRVRSLAWEGEMYPM